MFDVVHVNWKRRVVAIHGCSSAVESRVLREVDQGLDVKASNWSGVAHLIGQHNGIFVVFSFTRNRC